MVNVLIFARTTSVLPRLPLRFHKCSIPELHGKVPMILGWFPVLSGKFLENLNVSKITWEVPTIFYKLLKKIILRKNNPS